MTRPALPATRDERIALARTTIEAFLFGDEQLHPEHLRDYAAPAVVVFQVQVESFDDGTSLNDDLTEALITAAGFPAVTCESPAQRGDGWICSFRVPVGAP